MQRGGNSMWSISVCGTISLATMPLARGGRGSFTFRRFQNTHLSHPLFISWMTRGGGAASRIVCQECSTDTNKASGFLEMGGVSLDEGVLDFERFYTIPPSP
ncbi:hypothetical protein CDAR_559161 [Caerostris darwini]|uniref:Secreted protein n=1 Tax=Caerostris darwini TaxID=1538125 RepID=A0AAV4NYY8_9ARAC|nr:hypothetical protein CDAR_559161 [Caerostris darwini]